MENGKQDRIISAIISKTTRWNNLHLLCFLSATSIILLLLVSLAHSAPKADLWPRWQQHDPTSSKRIDHSIWDTYLKKYVISPHLSGVNRVRYNAITPDDRRELKRYLDLMQSLPIASYNRDEQKAYWINLYNALTIHVVLSHHPVDSIRDIGISPGWFSSGPWGAKLLSIEGEKISLDDIEHRILRPIWKDNRVHYSVNCASIGCPNLAGEAYTGQNLERLLEQGARDYINHPRGATLKGGQLQVSSIYIWFQEDFGGSEEGVLDHLRQYANAPLAEILKSYNGELTHDYNWHLNTP